MKSERNVVTDEEGGEQVISQNGASVCDIRAIMADIRKEILENQSTDQALSPSFQPSQGDPQSSRRAGEIVSSEELRHLNVHYAYPLRRPGGFESHRKGIFGKLIVRLKRKLASVLWDGVLQEYFNQQKEYNAHLVRLLNQFSRYVDERDASNFWELIRKIDVDITSAINRIDRIQGDQSASVHSSEKRLREQFYRELTAINERVTSVQSVVEKHAADLREVDSVSRGIESIVSRASKRQPSVNGSSPDFSEGPEYSYLLLENRYRVNEETISKHLEFYLPHFERDERPILEIGCGRGELLSLFRDSAMRAVGIDIDEAMIEACHEKGLDARLADGIAYLSEVQDDSLNGVIAIQVVEHLTQRQLERFFSLCFAKVRQGGKIIVETINPTSLLALSSNYFRDPTHIWPLHPDTLRYTMSLAGLPHSEVIFRSPVPEGALLKKIEREPFMSPRWSLTVGRLNDNIDRLNSLLFGYQDYCIVATNER
ncbi:MAG: methyltransferase domain-containing protein [Bdellovibrionales bacterium]|nr:methyltransferase domain-containing protein [Bdellovibrionales bacterium]